MGYYTSGPNLQYHAEVYSHILAKTSWWVKCTFLLFEFGFGPVIYFGQILASIYDMSRALKNACTFGLVL